MTYRDALRDFKRDVLPAVVEKYGDDDKPAKGQAWSTYVDGLARDGQITDRQARTWGNPFNK